MKNVLIAGLICLISATSIAQVRTESKNANTSYGKNIIAFHPVHMITRNFVGVGFSYERMTNPYMGIKIPVMFAINNNYVNVGLEAKLYPTKNSGPVKYAIAPTLMMGIGEDENVDWYWINGIYTKVISKEPSNHFAFLLNQTLNITITRQFYIGLEGGFGINYFDEVARNSIDNNSNLSAVAQMHVGMGYRF